LRRREGNEQTAADAERTEAADEREGDRGAGV
jgi:hypothetical protein